MKKFPFIFLFTFLLFSNKSFGQNTVDVNTSVDSTRILIGDPIKLKLKTSFDPQSNLVILPNIPDTFNHFEIIEIQKADTVQNKNKTQITQQILITNFDSGAWYIPAFEYKVSPLNGVNSYTLHSDSILIQVQTIAVDTSKPFKPIFGLRPVNRPLQQIIQYILIALAAIAAIVLLIYYYRKKYKQQKSTPKP